MIYRIEEISTDRASKHTYALVHFWSSQASRDAGDLPALINDFLMQLRDTGIRIIVNTDGDWKRSDGVFVAWADIVGDETWEKEPFIRDVPNEMRINIEEYWQRAQARGDTGSRTSLRIRRTSRDPYGILARADVTALVGSEAEGDLDALYEKRRQDELDRRVIG